MVGEVVGVAATSTGATEPVLVEVAVGDVIGDMVIFIIMESSS